MLNVFFWGETVNPTVLWLDVIVLHCYGSIAINILRMMFSGTCLVVVLTYNTLILAMYKLHDRKRFCASPRVFHMTLIELTCLH